MRAWALRVPALAVALVAASGARAGGLTLVSQDREVLVDIEVVEAFYASCLPLLDPFCMPDSTTVTDFEDSETAPGATPFVATALAPPFIATTASQDSEITGSRVRASGSHAAASTWSNTGGFPITFFSETHGTESRAVVVFTLTSETPYTLTGSVVTGGSSFSPSSSHLRLSGPGGIVAEAQVDSDPGCLDPSCFTVGPEPLAASGSLAAGTYTLEARAGGSAGGLHSTAGSFGSSMDGAFDVDLVLAGAVPSAGPAGLATLSLLLGCVGSSRLRTG